jgi:putative isomerase
MDTKLVLFACCLIGISSTPTRTATTLEALAEKNSAHFPDKLISDAIDTQKNTLLLVREIKTLMEARGVRHHEKSGREYYTSYTDLYDWELFFDGLALAYFGGESYAINGLKMFLSDQRPDGFISRRILQKLPENKLPEDELFAEEGKEHCKPFLFQTALVIGRTRGNLDWLAAGDYQALKRYLQHWFTAWDKDGNGLCEWSSAPHSGSDTQLERIGPWGSRYCEGTDLNCIIYRECQAAASIAKVLCLEEDAAYFDGEAQRRGLLIQQMLWDEKDGFFYDRDIRNGKPIKVKSGAGFIPLWAGIATARQARILVERHLRNAAEFWTPFPIPSYARSEPSYTQYYQPAPGAEPVYGLGPGHSNWCGGMWPHWNYLISHGLMDYGFVEEAKHIAHKLHEAVSAKEGLYEWYDAETGKGQGLNPFWAGATIVGALLPAELELGFDPSKPKTVTEKLDFQPIRDTLGIDGSFHPKVVH